MERLLMAFAVMVLFTLYLMFGSPGFISEQDIVRQSPYIAIVNIDNVQCLQSDCSDNEKQYTQQATVTTYRQLKGDLPPTFKMRMGFS